MELGAPDRSANSPSRINCGPHATLTIEEQGGGKQKALDRNAMLLGSYDPSTNSTLDANRVLVGRGNQLSALIERAR